MASHRNSNPLDAAFLAWLERQDDAVLLETARLDASNRRSLLFVNPVRVVRADSPEEVEAALEAVAAAVEDGLHAAGWIAFEAGYALEEALRPLARAGSAPLLWMGLYREPVVVNPTADAKALPPTGNSPTLQPKPTLGEDEYAQVCREVHERIAAGDTYQTNLTFKLRFQHPGSAGELYARLRRAQPVPYAAFIRAGGQTILSLSPELFFRTDGRRITLKPMKGTAPRGRTPTEDRERRAWLETSAKNRAENLMIVDMLRNDVGRIARTGTVEVPRFFAIETHPTLFQATSTIEARLRRGVRIPEIVRALFPCGSVTGAPKIRTMQIIRELEPEPRMVYTGAIGFFAPGGQAVFSVAIRTLTLDTDGRGEMGVGSGIVADSEAGAEYEECLLKGRFLAEPPEDFELFETLLWRAGWKNVRGHLARLRVSARRLGFAYSRQAALAALEGCRPSKPSRGRLMLARTGEVRLETAPLEALPARQRVRVSAARTDSQDALLAHKTTRRALYDAELRAAQEAGCFDVLFLNDRGEVTEGARSNVLVRVGDTYRTPPLECGLLPGTLRARLLRGPLDVREAVLKLGDLRAADAVYLCNALRGLMEVELEV